MNLLLALCGPRDERPVHEVLDALSGFKAIGVMIDGIPYIRFIPVRPC